MLQRCAALVAAAGLAIGTAGCAQTDAAITTNVSTRLAADERVSIYELDVETSGGVVTLSGVVDRPGAKEQALAIAREADGVRDVVDLIRVDETAATTGVQPGPGDRAGDPGGPDRGDGALNDAAITATVKSKLLADTTVGGLQVDVDTINGIVTLRGDVESKVESDRAMMLARQTEGVVRVVNHMRVLPESPPQ